MPVDPHLTSQQSQCDTNRAVKSYGPGQVVCVVHSKHPLTLGTIRRVLSSTPSLQCSVKRYDLAFRQPRTERCEILILDTCSIPCWQEDLAQWRSGEGRAIALISPELDRTNESFRMVSLGATGIIPFCEELDAKLPSALAVVAQGGLWIKRQVLSEYVRRTSQLLSYMLYPERLVTSRERQIINFLSEGLSNKEIAHALHISERTVKFHVSNILRKCEFESRRELRGKSSEANVRTCPETMNLESSKPSFSAVQFDAKRAIPNREACLPAALRFKGK